MRIPRFTKIAGLSFVGFCAAAAIADRVNLTPVASQIAGFAGALAGTLVARGRRRRSPPPPAVDPPPER